MVAIPVGPVGLLIIQRSIAVGFLRGFMSGLGAALADGLFGFLAALGLVALVEQLEASRHIIRPFGSLILLLVGIYFYFHKPKRLETDEVLTSRYLHQHIWDLLSTFFLTLMNPLTVIAFAALFAGSDLIPEDPKKIQYVEIALGVFTGSLAWWLLLVVAATPLKKRLSIIVEKRIHQVIGLVLATLAVLSFVPRFSSVMGKVGDFLKGYL